MGLDRLDRHSHRIDPITSSPRPLSESKISPAAWLWAGGAAVIVFAARCREIQLYAGETPYLDQWKVEGQQILLPWLQGTLSWRAFFTPHHEHIPAWTRLLVWLEAAWFNRWDPQLQCTINAVLFGTVVGGWVGWFRRTMPLLAAFVLSLLAIALAVLPHGWENSTWGFQSHVPLALLFVTLHVRGSFERTTGSAGWWLAQAAGLAALFTFGSMWAAPAAVVLTALWTAAPGRWRWSSPAFLAIGGLGLLIFARSVQAHAGAFTYGADSPQQFLAAFLVQLGWPAQWPGAAVLLYFPSFLLALRLRQNPRAANADRVALALALWAAAQAAAFALGRGSYLGFVSRYGDLLALGVLANGFSLWRLLHRQTSWRPLTLVTLMAAAWLAAVGHGLGWISTRAHTEYFHERAPVWIVMRRDAVRQYLATKDPSQLATETVRGILYPDPAVVATVLDQPGIRQLLPASLRNDRITADGDFFSDAAGRLRELWPYFVSSGIVLFLLGGSLAWRDHLPTAPASPGLPVDRVCLLWVALLCATAGGSLFLWPMPFEFRSAHRWGNMLRPPGVVTGLSFLITTPTTYPVDNLTGGAALWPEDFRNTFYGTHIDGPAFTGRAQSSLFPIGSPWLVIPYAGFPVSVGNALRLQIEDHAGKVLAELTCPGPNPVDIDFWSVDVRAFAGQQARIVFFDGRNDAQGWLAAAPPQPARDGGQARRLERSWKLERTTVGQRSLGVVFVSLFGFFLVLAFQHRFRPAAINHRVRLAQP